MVRNSIIKKLFKSQIWCESGSGTLTRTCRAHAFQLRPFRKRLVPAYCCFTPTDACAAMTNGHTGD